MKKIAGGSRVLTIVLLAPLGMTIGCLDLTNGTEQEGGSVGEGAANDRDCINYCDFRVRPALVGSCVDGVQREEQCTSAQTCTFVDFDRPQCVSCEEVGEVPCEDGDGCCGDGSGGGDGDGDECTESCDYNAYPEIATTCDDNGVKHEQECTGAQTCSFDGSDRPECVSCEQVGEVACADGNGCCQQGSGGGGPDVPDGWTCRPEYWGDGGCDCGCGVSDPDCRSGGCTSEGCSAEECEFCWDAAVCGSSYEAPVDDEPADDEPADDEEYCEDWCLLDDEFCDNDSECGGAVCEGDDC